MPQYPHQPLRLAARLALWASELAWEMWVEPCSSGASEQEKGTDAWTDRSERLPARELRNRRGLANRPRSTASSTRAVTAQRPTSGDWRLQHAMMFSSRPTTPTPGNRRSTRVGRGTTTSQRKWGRSSSRGDDSSQSGVRLASGKARKWAKVMRPPAPGVGFSIPTWVPVSKLTEEELRLHAPKKEDELEDTANKTDEMDLSSEPNTDTPMASTTASQSDAADDPPASVESTGNPVDSISRNIAIGPPMAAVGPPIVETSDQGAAGTVVDLSTSLALATEPPIATVSLQAPATSKGNTVDPNEFVTVEPQISIGGPETSETIRQEAGEKINITTVEPPVALAGPPTSETIDQDLAQASVEPQIPLGGPETSETIGQDAGEKVNIATVEPPVASAGPPTSETIDQDLAQASIEPQISIGGPETSDTVGRDAGEPIDIATVEPPETVAIADPPTSGTIDQDCTQASSSTAAIEPPIPTFGLQPWQTSTQAGADKDGTATTAPPIVATGGLPKNTLQAMNAVDDPIGKVMDEIEAHRAAKKARVEEQVNSTHEALRLHLESVSSNRRE